MSQHLTSKLLALSLLVGSTIQNANGVDPLYRGEVDTMGAEITWDNKQRPAKRDEILPIDPPLPRLGPSEPDVEVLEFVDYELGRGRTGARATWGINADELSVRWRESLPPQVNVIRVPIASRQSRGEDAAQLTARTRLQAILTARLLGIEEEIQDQIVVALNNAPQAVSTKAELRTLFDESLDITRDDFENAWSSPEVGIAIRRAMTTHRTIVETAVRRRGRTRNPTPPILLINGEHIVASYKIRRAGDAFRIANGVIARELSASPAPTEAERRWRTLYEELRLLRRPDIAYNADPGPTVGQAIEIDPPLPTASPEGTLEIEWFFSYLNRGYNRHRTTSWLSGRAERLILEWAQTVPPADFAKLRARFTPVTAIPGHDGTSREHARMLQELALGFGYTTTASPRAYHPTHISPALHFGIRGTLAYNAPPTVLDDEKDIRQLVQRLRLPVKEYVRVASSEEPERRADAADARFDLLVERTKHIAPNAFEAPAYPIILIDGRYLVTGSTAGSYAGAAKIANTTIQRLLAERAE